MPQQDKNNENQLDVIGVIKKLSHVLILEGMYERNGKSLALGNALGVICASFDLGAKQVMLLMKTLEPVIADINKEMEKNNPDLKNIATFSLQDAMKNGNFDPNFIKSIIHI